MGSDTSKFSLDAISFGVFDCPHSTPRLSDEGPFMARTQDIRKGYFDTSVAVRVDEEVYAERTKRVEPVFGDVLFSREGTYFGDAAEVPKHMRVCLGQRMVLIRPNPEIIRPSYLRMQINSAYFQAMLRQYRDGTVAERLNLPVIRSLKISVPPLPEQDFVIRNISPLEKKIELNRQISTTLEAMAQTLFKSWFVDFDPVIDNALAAGNPIPDELADRAERRAQAAQQPSPEQPHTLPTHIRQQFPDRFVFTEEMGWVPEGWNLGCFRDLADHVRENVKADDISESDLYVGLEHIGRKEIFLSEHGLGESVGSNKSQFTKDDLLFGKLRPYFHKVCIAPSDGICSTDILVLRAKAKALHSYMVLTAYTEEFVDYANLRATGTRMPRANAKDLLQYPVVIPPARILMHFESALDPIWAKGTRLIEENRSLANLRDTLLPKLLSGQLRIPEAEQLLAEAL